MVGTTTLTLWDKNVIYSIAHTLTLSLMCMIKTHRIFLWNEMHCKVNQSRFKLKTFVMVLMPKMNLINTLTPLLNLFFTGYVII